MPDDVKPADPAISPEQAAQVMDALSERVAAHLQAKVAGAAQANARAQAANQPNPVRDMVMGAVGGDLARSHLESLSAQDYAKFYTREKEASEFEGEIEQKFEALKNAGTPWSRADIWKYVKGEKEDLFYERRQKRHQEQVARANQEQDMGPSSQRGGRGGSVDAYSLGLEDLEKSMQGVTF